MVDFNDLKTAGIFKIEIEPKYAFDEGSQQYEAWDGVVLTFRELTGKEATAAFNAKDEKERSEKMFNTFKDTLVDHNITEGGEKKAKKDVLELLYESSTAYTYCINAWSNSLPLARANSGRSGKSAKT